jgi:hypothetical protein
VGELLRGQPLADDALATRLAEPAEKFRSECAPHGVDPLTLLDHLTAISVEPCGIEEQARVAIRKVGGEYRVNAMLSAISSWVRQIQSLFLEVHPRALDDLELRAVPLREQWEARGPGLLHALKATIGEELVAENADVVLVQPVLGGGGVAHIAYNRVSFEAVLANPVGELPEVLRLGWLLAQLHLDLPTIQGVLSRPRAFEIGALALVPPILAAGHNVELCGPLETFLPTALAAWRLPNHNQDALIAWWETYRLESPSWHTALAALDRLLVEEAL